jgi:hypothetical protein
MVDLERLRAIENLQRAWRWICSNPDTTYKFYFRNLYRNYAVAADALLSDLADRLKRGVYQPMPTCKLFFPKPSGILRPFSLLSVEDQIVYQAAVNLIAEKLFPRVKSKYHKLVFGHLYARKTSAWFYRKWSDGYKAFNDAARKAYADGFTYTASFDLTACYDSLDHGVLRHFLGKLGLDPEFCRQLSSWLECWAATDSGIFQNHGIPQGPLSSGLLSEVILSHFDSVKVQSINFHYFRYVDDIRLFAKNEKDLRRLLVSLDLLSKDVGLFPQSGKIGIHRVLDIEKELKTVSNPSESAIMRKKINQKKLFQRIVRLTHRYVIADTTRFKYLLAHAVPNAALTDRLWRVFDKQPEIYKAICNYLYRYPKLPRVPATKIIDIIKKNTLYHSVQADFIGAADGKLPKPQDNTLSKYLLKQWSPSTLHSDLLARSGLFLLRTGYLSARQVVYVCNSSRSWWARATLIDNVALNYVDSSTRDNILDQRIQDKASDVALAAGWTAFVDGVTLSSQRRLWNRSGAIFLREVGMIQRNTASYCGITKSFHNLDPKIPFIKWKRLLGGHYEQAERQAVEIVALSATNITAFVNALDVFNDLLLNTIFTTDGTIGSYQLGNIGGALQSDSCRLAVKFPRTFIFAKTVHNERYASMYSHSRIGRTSRPTKKINYRFLGKAKALLRASVMELSVAGF